MPEPAGARSTIGTLAAPPSMKWILAAWLTIWSIAQVTKSENCISTIGRSPHSAAPTAAPTMRELGDRGVADPLGPNRSSRPLVTPNAPP